MNFPQLQRKTHSTIRASACNKVFFPMEKEFLCKPAFHPEYRKASKPTMCMLGLSLQPGAETDTHLSECHNWLTFKQCSETCKLVQSCKAVCFALQDFALFFVLHFARVTFFSWENHSFTSNCKSWTAERRNAGFCAIINAGLLAIICSSVHCRVIAWNTQHCSKYQIWGTFPERLQYTPTRY